MTHGYRGCKVAKLNSFAIEGCENMTVNELMNEDNLSWNAELIRGLFAEEEAELILGIPLSVRSREDKLVWAPFKDGKYSVRSAYRLLRNDSIDNRDSDKKMWAHV